MDKTQVFIVTEKDDGTHQVICYKDVRKVEGETSTVPIGPNSDRIYRCDLAITVRGFDVGWNSVSNDEQTMGETIDKLEQGLAKRRSVGIENKHD